LFKKLVSGGVASSPPAEFWAVSSNPARDRCFDFLNIFAEKFRKKSAFLAQNKAKLIITLVFKKNANFFAENWGESQKIVITTSTPG
jgi:hypothetical protein